MTASTQNWRNWTATTPPTPGAYKTAKGWAFKHPNGLEEILVALGSPGQLDALAASIASIEVPTSSFYVLNNVLSFYVNFNEEVTVTNTPRLAITLASGTVYATYAAGSGTNRLRFDYTVVNNNLDLDGIALQNNIDLNTTGTIKDKGTSTDATITFTGSNYTTSGIKVDAVARTVSTVTSPSGNVTTGNPVNVTATFNQPVLVDTTGGTPRIQLFQNDGTTPVGYATYVSGSGTAAIVFRYVVQSGDVVATAAKAGANIGLNGGAITDMSGTVNATVTFAQATLTGVTLN